MGIIFYTFLLSGQIHYKFLSTIQLNSPQVSIHHPTKFTTSFFIRHLTNPNKSKLSTIQLNPNLQSDTRNKSICPNPNPQSNAIGYIDGKPITDEKLSGYIQKLSLLLMSDGQKNRQTGG